MDAPLTVEELEQRREHALRMSQTAVIRQPGVYRELKSMAGDVASQPVDITDYLPGAQKLVELLQRMDPTGKGTIFHFFKDRITPSSVWDVGWLRLECKDLLAHLEAFNGWRLKQYRMKIVK